MGFGLVNDRHIAIALKFIQVNSYEVFQFIDGIAGAVNLLPKTFEDVFGPVTENLNQNIVFIGKIKVDSPVGYTGLFGDSRNSGLVIALPGKDFDSGIENAMIFIVFFFITDFGASWSTSEMNVHSFYSGFRCLSSLNKRKYFFRYNNKIIYFLIVMN
jgi:hypothetical protein